MPRTSTTRARCGRSRHACQSNASSHRSCNQSRGRQSALTLAAVTVAVGVIVNILICNELPVGWLIHCPQTRTAVDRRVPTAHGMPVRGHRMIVIVIGACIVAREMLPGSSAGSGAARASSGRSCGCNRRRRAICSAPSLGCRCTGVNMLPLECTGADLLTVGWCCRHSSGGSALELGSSIARPVVSVAAILGPADVTVPVLPVPTALLVNGSRSGSRELRIALGTLIGECGVAACRRALTVRWRPRLHPPGNTRLCAHTSPSARPTVARNSLREPPCH